MKQPVMIGGGKLTKPTAARGGATALPAEGVTLAVLIGYCEMGIEVSKKENKWGKFPKQQPATLTFALISPKHLELDEAGNIKRYKLVYVNVNETYGEKSMYMTLMNALDYDKSNRHVSEMIGELFKVEVVHNVVGSKTYANLHNGAAWLIWAPRNVDPITDTVTTLKIPATFNEPTHLFLYEQNVTDESYLEMWDSVFIDGVRGNGSSANWRQERIMNSQEWRVSRIKELVDNRKERSTAPTSPPSPSTPEPMEEVW